MEKILIFKTERRTSDMRFKLICVTIAALLAFSCIPASVSASSSELPDPVLVAFGDSIAAAGKWQTAFRALSEYAPRLAKCPAASAYSSASAALRPFA